MAEKNRPFCRYLPMPFIRSVCAHPAHLTFPLSEVLDAARSWLTEESEAYLLFERFIRTTGTQKRRYALPLEEILALSGDAERARRFQDFGSALARSAIGDALAAAHLEATAIDVVIFTSCTSPLIPALDATLLPAMGFPATVTRLPIYQHGCAGGVVGLALAHRFAAGGDRVLLTSTEICSLLFRHDERSVTQLLGAALFADGAGCAVVDPEAGEVEIVRTRSFLIPDTTHLMGYDIRNSGTYLRLHRDLPDVLCRFLRDAVEDFLGEDHLTPADVPWWLVHPGGLKILHGFAALFSLRPEQLAWSYEILADVGNLSSASILFALAHFLDDGVASPGNHMLMAGIGPGLTVELLLLRFRGQAPATGKSVEE